MSRSMTIFLACWKKRKLRTLVLASVFLSQLFKEMRTWFLKAIKSRWHKTTLSCTYTTMQTTDSMCNKKDTLNAFKLASIKLFPKKNYSCLQRKRSPRWLMETWCQLTEKTSLKTSSTFRSQKCLRNILNDLSWSLLRRPFFSCLNSLPI